MKACTFFGHRDCPGLVKPRLREVLIDLICNQGVDTFYVGNQGQFDGIVRSVLRELEKEYPEIHYAVVLAYLPGKKNEYDDFSDTILPEGIEAVHPRYAVDWRNRWMLQRADFVVTYITHPLGRCSKVCGKSRTDRKNRGQSFPPVIVCPAP